MLFERLDSRQLLAGGLDVNQDDQLTPNDALLVANAVNTNSYTPTADTNGDGLVNDADFAAVLAALESALTAEGETGTSPSTITCTESSTWYCTASGSDSGTMSGSDSGATEIALFIRYEDICNCRDLPESPQAVVAPTSIVQQNPLGLTKQDWDSLAADRSGWLSTIPIPSVSSSANGYADLLSYTQAAEALLAQVQSHAATLRAMLNNPATTPAAYMAELRVATQLYDRYLLRII